MEPRRRNYALLQDGYRLYDQGLSERIKGNYGLAIDKLTEASNLLDQARSHQRDGRASTLESMVFFELGLCAEEDNDLSLARDSYAKAFRANPRYVEAYLRGARLQAENGNKPLALSIIKEGLQNLSDPRLETMLELLDDSHTP
jgi:tetratricopeptide (TPR) repeat protein